MLFLICVPAFRTTWYFAAIGAMNNQKATKFCFQLNNCNKSKNHLK